MPAPAPSTVISRPPPFHRAGQSEYSPENLTRLLLIAAPLASVHVRPVASTKLVAPIAWVVKSTFATTVPLMPLRSWNAYTLPDAPVNPRVSTSPTVRGAVEAKMVPVGEVMVLPSWVQVPLIDGAV
jgi:hypothetical protein